MPTAIHTMPTMSAKHAEHTSQNRTTLTAHWMPLMTANNNEMLYIVEGVDPAGRKFRGLYNKEDAEYLANSDRLNRILGTFNKCDTINQ